MAVITPDTFDSLRRYVGVRLQQGVPLVDADWNELEDVRKFELRTFLKWFVGDGVPDGNDGFRIVGTGSANDFTIAAGVSGSPDGLANVGRCLINGLDVIIPTDLDFTDQPLHVDQPGSAALAAALGVPAIQAMTTPTGDGTVVGYIDVWERLVTPTEDPGLVLPGLGTESCARIKRDWVVRARNGTSVPATGDPDHLAGHDYYALGTIARRAADPNVAAGDVIDVRERRLLVPPATLITDLLGVTPADYRRGLSRPAISLREAINALLRGELPSTPDAAIVPAPGIDVTKRAFLFDNSNGIAALWQSDRVGGTNQVFAARLDLNNVSAGFVAPPQQVTTGGAHSEGHAALLPNGDLMVVYQSGMGAVSDISFKRAPLAGLNAVPEVVVASTAGFAETGPSVVVSANLAVIFYHLGAPTNLWQFRRRNHVSNTWVDAGPQQLSAQSAPQRDSHAVPDGSGRIWAAFRATANIAALQLTPSSGAVANETTHDSGLGVDQNPFVLVTAVGDVWVFWASPSSLHAVRFSGGAWQPIQTIPNTIAADRQPCSVEDAEGGIWLFWTRGSLGTGDIYFMRRNPATGAWGQPRQLTMTPNDDSIPFALQAPNNAAWIFWTSDRDGNFNPYFKRLVTAV